MGAVSGRFAAVTSASRFPPVIFWITGKHNYDCASNFWIYCRVSYSQENAFSQQLSHLAALPGLRRGSNFPNPLTSCGQSLAQVFCGPLWRDCRIWLWRGCCAVFKNEIVPWASARCYNTSSRLLDDHTACCCRFQVSGGSLTGVFSGVPRRLCFDAYEPFAAPQMPPAAQERSGMRLSQSPSAWTQCRGDLRQFLMPGIYCL